MSIEIKELLFMKHDYKKLIKIISLILFVNTIANIKAENELIFVHTDGTKIDNQNK